MEDAAIVALYWARDEQALAETAAKFGAYCRKIADNILHSAHDAEECENDTWLAAWNSMPTNRPARLAPYLGRITRNLALDRFDRAAAQKPFGRILDPKEVARAVLWMASDDSGMMTGAVIPFDQSVHGGYDDAPVPALRLEA